VEMTWPFFPEHAGPKGEGAKVSPPNVRTLMDSLFRSLTASHRIESLATRGTPKDPGMHVGYRGRATRRPRLLTLGAPHSPFFDGCIPPKDTDNSRTAWKKRLQSEELAWTV